MQSLDCLVIVYTDPAVFALQVGQLDVVVRCRLVDLYDFHWFVEEGGKYELGFVFGSRVLEKPFELDVLEFVQAETIIVGMKLGLLLGSPSASSFACFVSLHRLARITDLCHTFKCFIYSTAK